MSQLERTIYRIRAHPFCIYVEIHNLYTVIDLNTRLENYAVVIFMPTTAFELFVYFIHIHIH